KHQALNDPDSEHIKPSLAEIEKMRVEQTCDHALHNEHETEPVKDGVSPKQQEMRDPHREQHDAAHDAELERYHENLIVRIVGDDRRMAFQRRIAAKQVRNRSGSVTKHRCARKDAERLSPIFKALPLRRANVGLIGANILRYLQNPIAQIWRGYPCRTRYRSQNEATTQRSFPSKLPVSEQTR